MKTYIRQRRDFEAMAQRRKRAARLFAAGKMILARIAYELEVSRQSVSRWYEQWKRGGNGALGGAGRAGRNRSWTGNNCNRSRLPCERGQRLTGLTPIYGLFPRSCCCRAFERRSLSPGTCVEDTGIDRLDLAAAARRAKERNPEKVKRWVDQSGRGKKNARRPKSMDLLRR